MNDPITEAVDKVLGPNEPPAVSRRLFLTCPDCHGYGYQLHGRTTRRMTSQLFPVEQSERTSDDYLTPKWVFDALGLEFDLDVASPPWETHVPAARKFTKADDGLSQPWQGRVWMNPPFSKGNPWARRFMAHGHGIALLPQAKSQWQIDLWRVADGIALPDQWFDFDGRASIFIPVFFAAFGDECVAALHNLGRVR